MASVTVFICVAAGSRVHQHFKKQNAFWKPSPPVRAQKLLTPNAELACKCLQQPMARQGLCCFFHCLRLCVLISISVGLSLRTCSPGAAVSWTVQCPCGFSPAHNHLAHVHKIGAEPPHRNHIHRLCRIFAGANKKQPAEAGRLEK